MRLLEDKTLGLVVQTISGLHSNPGGVPAGTGGLADDSGTPAWLPISIGLGALIAVGGVARIATTRR